MDLRRLMRHLACPSWRVKKTFPEAALAKIEEAVRDSEKRHAGEIRFAVQASLDPASVFKGTSPRERAIALFSELRVWDTGDNNGVLIYILLADRSVEIIVDRGLNGKTAPAEWESICRAMEESFRKGLFLEGALEGIGQATAILARHYPPGAWNPDELPDKPFIV